MPAATVNGRCRQQPVMVMWMVPCASSPPRLQAVAVKGTTNPIRSQATNPVATFTTLAFP